METSGNGQEQKTRSFQEKNRTYNLQLWVAMVKTQIGIFTRVICLHEFPSRQLLALDDGRSSSSARRAAFPLEAFRPWTAQSSPWPVTSRSKINPTHEPASATNTHRQSPGRQTRHPSLRFWRHPCSALGDACINFMYGCKSLVAWQWITMQHR